MSEIMALKFHNFLQSEKIQQRPTCTLLFGMSKAYPKHCNFAKKNEFHNLSS